MVNMENYEEYMLLEADGELGDAERKALYAFLEQHPELGKEMEMYLSTKLVPDTKMVFAHKEQLLKKQGGSTIAFGGRWMYAAAACVAALIAVMIWKREPSATETNTIVKTEEPVKNVTPAPIVDDTAKEFHSKTVNAIAIENKTPVKPNTIKKPKAPVTPVEPEEKIAQQPVERILPDVKQEIPQPKQNTVEQKVQANEKPVAFTEEVKIPVITEEPETQQKPLLAWLPVNEEKKEGLNVIAEVLNQKIDKIKEVRNSLKDTDVTFRIGNKELFIVRL